MIKFWDETNLAIEAARAAGKKILQVYQTDFKTERKADYEPITLADRTSQKTILEVLGSSHLPVLSEEQEDDLLRLKQERVWIVDPLDGTADFVARTDEFCVMIALVESQISILGVIYEPTNDTLFVAQKGEGAYICKNGHWERLRVSNVQGLDQIRAVMSRNHLLEEEKDILAKIGVKNFVQMGSAGLKAAGIAEGRFDLYFTMTNKIKQWDTAAANCLINEAGGKITDLAGKDLIYNMEDVYHRDGILMSNGKIHGEVLKIYRGFKNKQSNN
ncbi:MAG: 3'(2'),5'-bisphosphate nucleotidase CysQ [Candidatus Doudnabacteria bacterium]|nr:3'(2'),5'-bisphosphate nucleotidase CysQ [bacterium]MDZ4244264.1 3'(2'),5'-bisphosphate nucleotidase CysQ [Candidatus Doudnabacteria bacterium]